MAITNGTATSGRKSSLDRLTVYLRGAISQLKETNLLVIPLDTVNGFLESFDRLEEPGFPELIALFDGQNKGNCSRLDLVSFHCMLHILLRAPPCLARDRGFYLFLKSMRDLTDGIQNSQHYTVVVASRQRKSLIGQKTFKLLLSTFVSRDVDAPRKWSGQFILELVRKSQDKAGLIALVTEENNRKIGATVLGETDYILRLLASVIIQEMVASQLDPRIFWPPDTPQHIMSKFFSGSPIDSNWVGRFNGFVSGQDSGKNQETQKMHIVETIEAGPLTIGNSNSTIGILVSRVLTVMITEINRFRFIKIRLEHINKVVLHEKTAVLHLYLHGNGFYMTNGLMEKSDVVSMVFENETQAVEVRNSLEQQCRSVKGDNGGIRKTNDFSNVGKYDLHGQRGTSADFICKMGVVQDSIILGPDTDKPTIQNPRRKPSYAAILLSFEEEVINGASAHLDLGVSDSPNEKDHDNPPAQYEQLVKNTVESEDWGSYPSRVDEISELERHAASRSHSQERNPNPEITLDIANLSKTQDTSCGGETKCGSGDVEPHISQTGHDYLFGLPRLARQALRLQLQHQPQTHDSNSLTAAPIQEDQVERSRIDLGSLVVEDTPLTANNPNIDPEGALSIRVDDYPQKDTNPSPVNSTTMGLQTKVPVQEPSECRKEAECPKHLGSNSKLKRPHNRMSESKANQLTVDWDQDLRVEDQVERPARSPKRQKKTVVEPKGPTNTSKTKNVSRSVGKKNNKNNKRQQGLPLTPHITSASAKRKTNKVARQLTKTLTSARQRRAAAEKANQKLALTNRYENAPYDVDDPIESSPIEHSTLAGDNRAGKVSTDASNAAVTSEDVNVQPLGSTEGVASAKTHPPTPKISDPIVFPQIIGSQQPVGNEGNGSPFFHTIREGGDNHLDFQGIDLPARGRGSSAPPAKMDNPDSLSNINEPHQNTVAERRGDDLGKRLSEALAKAGIPLSNSLIGGAEGNTRKGLSEISKNVSQFIARQAVVAQQFSIDQHGKLDDSKTQPGKHEEVPVKAIKQKVEAGGGASEVCEKQHEGQAGLLTTQCQPEETAEHHGISQPNCNSQNKVKGNINDVLPETAVVLRKVQLVGFDASRPKNQCAISVGPANLNSMKIDIITNEIPQNGEVYLSENCLENPCDNGVNKIDDMDEVSLVPTSECPSLGATGEDDNVRSRICSSSVCEVTEAEFQLQARAVRLVPAQSQTVDENGSPQPLHRDLRVKRVAAKVPLGVGLQIDPSGISQPEKPSVSLSGEDSGIDHCPPASFDSESTNVDRRVQGLTVNIESYSSSNCETPPQRRSTSSKQKGCNVGRFAVKDRSDRKGYSFWRRSAPSTFAERLRAQKRTRQDKRSNGNKVTRKRSVVIKEVTQKPNIKPGLEFSSEREENLDISEAETYDAGVSSESNSNLSDTLVEECRDAESEWCNALRATQKTSLDILLDTSGRLIQRLLGEERAIAKVVDTYRNGGAKLIEQLEQRYDEELDRCENQLQPLKEELIERCEAMVVRLNNDRRHLLKQPTMKDLSTAVHKRKKLLEQADAAIKEYKTDA
ncbi:hypothetical protein AJ78_03283 [Emergomyces pasteurianus Ep9510]|uniref:PH-like domain-containing protein n=1 Tax=Emergomyces pasteurianus Ep9510 TaxID=1447872 RepID=A0A1J9PL01_9EURO|nr:hypothetical protein AJ78_03283 [Emergomyces pasteurianus Ep9510]